jgi:hypothetical protein
MEMNPGQAQSTKVMALAHNVRTIISDFDLFKAEHPRSQVLPQVEQAIERLSQGYAGLLAVFQELVGSEVADAEGHIHAHEAIGNERTLTEQAHHDAGLARRFETR